MIETSRVELGGVPGMFGASLTGKRERDEDFVAGGEFGNVRVAVLCDGMGGGQSGEKASEIAAGGFVKGVGTILRKHSGSWGQESSRHNAYSRVIEICHESVSSMAGGAGLSGTTLTALVVTYDSGSPALIDLVHIGDSRCYRVCEDEPSLITEDHSVTGDMVRAGYIEIHEIEETSGKNTLTRNIGDEGGTTADISSLDVRGGGCFLLCCDGVWGPLHTQSGLWVPKGLLCSQESADDMVGTAIERGSSDNCSVLIVDLSA